MTSQRCVDVGGQYADTIVEFTGTAVFDGVYCFWADSVGALMFALIIFTTVTIGMISFSETISLPLVTGVIASIMVLPLLPAVPTRFFAASIILIATAFILYLVWRLDRRHG